MSETCFVNMLRQQMVTGLSQALIFLYMYNITIVFISPSNSKNKMHVSTKHLDV